MAKKQVSGISGVLGELISEEPTPEEPASKKQPSAPRRDPETTAALEPPSTSPRQSARLGRPPGNGLRQSGPKEKVTLRVPSDLIAEYRDWSWEARCQLSELVERALVAYRKSRRRS